MAIKQIYFQEGWTADYLEKMQQFFGGAIEDNILNIEQGRSKVYVEAIPIFDGFELMLLSIETPEDILFHRTPDNNPNHIHLNVIKEGRYQQKFGQESTQMQYGTQNGVFLYDALFPITVEIPANSTLKIVGFKFDIAQESSVVSDALKAISTLFKDDKGIAYHADLSNESERLFTDIMHYSAMDKHRRALIVSRAIESFTILATNLEKLDKQDELNGLHIDDYKRLQSIKQILSTSFEERISVEQLAENHGVSVSKLKRDFKTLFNCSITQYYTNAKMDEAYRRLKSGKYTVSEVGYDMGYTNLSKFSEMFKKVKGISPRDVVNVEG